MSGWTTDLLRLLFPQYCVMCGNLLERTEEYLCATCQRDLPRTHFTADGANPLEREFWGHAPVTRAAAHFFYYKHNAACRILYELKYNHFPQIGVYMGQMMAREMQPSGFFEGIDLLVPVPLAPSRERQRGYNQCDMLAKGVSRVTSIPVSTGQLVRHVANPTQTRKGRMERWDNVQGIFSVTDVTPFSGRHILLIDDVITTGATLVSCMQALSAVPNLKVSILALAFVRE